MFATLSPTGEPVTVPELSQHGSDFGLHEFALRVWLAGEAGGRLTGSTGPPGGGMRGGWGDVERERCRRREWYQTETWMDLEL